MFSQAVVLEGKYWKRKLAAVTAEYKKWRMFYRNKILGWTNKDGMDMVSIMTMIISRHIYYHIWFALLNHLTSDTTQATLMNLKKF